MRWEPLKELPYGEQLIGEYSIVLGYAIDEVEKKIILCLEHSGTFVYKWEEKEWEVLESRLGWWEGEGVILDGILSGYAKGYVYAWILEVEG